MRKLILITLVAVATACGTGAGTAATVTAAARAAMAAAAEAAAAGKTQLPSTLAGTWELTGRVEHVDGPLVLSPTSLHVAIQASRSI